MLQGLLAQVKYVPGVFDDESVYAELGKVLDGFDEQAGVPLNRAFYLSTAPAFFPVIVEQLGRVGLNSHEDAKVRVIIEKPFGTTLEEARELNRRVLAIFDETQVFRIDHYLGKETVQNMMAFRFANGMFEPLWNRNFIDSVQITAAEDLGIGTRAGYYDQSGALRDLIQNHMLQLLCHVAMEPPVSFTAEEVRNEKVKVLQAIPEPTAAEIADMSVHAQYAPGTPAAKRCPATCRRTACPRARRPRPTRRCAWKSTTGAGPGVPFYLRTGKRLARKMTEIAVTLKPVPHLAFSQEGSLGVQPNQLVLALQPNEGVSLRLGAKIPGTRMLHPPGQHGVPLRHRVPVAVAGGLRATDHRRDARRRDAVHPQRRGRVAMAHLRPDHQRLGARHPGRCPSMRPARRGRRRPTACCARATAGARSDGDDRRRLERARHHARRDRSGASQAAGRAPRRKRQLRPGAGAEHDHLRRRRMERGDRQPPAPRRQLQRLAHCWCSPTTRAGTPSTRACRSPPMSIPSPASSRCSARSSWSEIGRRHLADLLTIADPLVVTDLPTLLWSPHGHPEVVDTLLELSQAMLLDSVEEPVWRDAIDRAFALSEQAYVVDLAWLRTTPWRERIAATFDPPGRGAPNSALTSVTVRHHVDSTVAAMLVVAWLASRLGWEIESRSPPTATRSSGTAARRAGGGRAAPGGGSRAAGAGPRGTHAEDLLRARARDGPWPRRPARALAKRRRAKSANGRSPEPRAGEAGILGEGIRQALLRDPTYVPALTAARAMLP